MDIEQLAKIVHDQANVLFPDRTDASMFLKMFSEFGELIEDGSEEEFADVMIMLLDYAVRKKFNISTAILRKNAINAKRNWAVNDLGVMRHV